MFLSVIPVLLGQFPAFDRRDLFAFDPAQDELGFLDAQVVAHHGVGISGVCQEKTPGRKSFLLSVYSK